MSRTWYGPAAAALLFPVLAANAWAQGGAPVCGSRGKLMNLESVALTMDQRLICFSEKEPQNEREIGPVTGLMGGELLVGIDFRPANGMLYGLGSQGGIYIVDPASGSATRQSVLTAMGEPVLLEGTSFGVDFNPVPDRLRVTSDTGQDLRINVDTGETLVDGVLSAPPGTPVAPAADDGALAPGGELPGAAAAPRGLVATNGTRRLLNKLEAADERVPMRGVTAIAYTNNDADPGTATVLYDIDTNADQLTIQAPPNEGTLNPVGVLGMNAGTDVSMDIFSQLQGNTTLQVRALVTFMVGEQTRLFTADLTSGRLTMVGTFDPDDRVIGLAIPLKQGK